jgi:hypothetical protein
MSSESTPGAALGRLVEVAMPAAKPTVTFRGEDGYPSIGFRDREEIARSVIAAVLPALADELQREAEERVHQISAAGWSAAAGHRHAGFLSAVSWLRSLAAPADDQEAQR